MTTAEAYKMRHGDAVTVHAGKPRAPQPRAPQPPAACAPPNVQWQERAWELTYTCQDALWSDAGARALSWLHGRGLSDEILQREFIGYHAGQPEHEDRAAWGLDADGKEVWLPRGVTIPWFVGSDLWRVNIRRPVGDPKYIGPAGWSNALFNADALTTDKPAILVEGELDAMTLSQVCGDIVTPCATGSTGGARRARWLAKLALCPRVLVAFDADQAGEEARRYWLGVLPNGKYWKPFWSDANQMYQDGADLRGWVSAGVDNGKP
jgi:5S rRNA maturation endonuclease (ribonuclease M5)